MAFHAQAEGFDPLQDHERIEGRNCHSEVTQQLHAGFQDERTMPERWPIGQAVIARIGINEILEPTRCAVIEGSAVSDRTPDGSPMAT